MSTAFVFAGELAWTPPERSIPPEVEAALALASKRGKVKWDRPARRLVKTQPLMVAACAGLVDHLARQGRKPDVVAGYGLGELSAWYAAGGVRLEDLIKVAVHRGTAMSHVAGAQGVIPAHAMPDGAVETSAYWGEQQVISGPATAVTAAVDKHSGHVLHNEGPWYASGMETAAQEMIKRLAKANPQKLERPLILSRDARAAPHSDAVPRMLAEQMERPIQFDRVLGNLRYKHRVQTLLLVGPSGNLEQLIRAALPGVTVEEVAW